jgi:hypothetical protein
LAFQVYVGWHRVARFFGWRHQTIKIFRQVAPDNQDLSDGCARQSKSSG